MKSRWYLLVSGRAFPSVYLEICFINIFQTQLSKWIVRDVMRRRERHERRWVVGGEGGVFFLLELIVLL